MTSSNSGSLAQSFAATTCAFLLAWLSLRLGLQEALVKFAESRADDLSRQYYVNVFSTLDESLLVVMALFLTMLVGWERIAAKLSILARDEQRIALAVLGILGSIQLGLILITPTTPIFDSLEYVKHAERIVATGGYVSEKGAATAYWPVGYPALLALFFIVGESGAFLAKCLNIGTSVSLVLVTYHFFRPHLNSKERTYFLLLSAFSPNLIFSASVLMTDYLFTALVWGALLLHVKSSGKAGPTAFLALLLGAASYVRPVGILLPMVFVWSMVRASGLRSCLRRISILAGVYVAVLAPWIIRNYNVFDAFVPLSTNGGYNFLMGNHPSSSGGVNHDFEYPSEKMGESAQSATAFRQGVKHIVADPLSAIARIPKKLLHLYKRGDSSVLYAHKSISELTSPLILSTAFLVSNLGHYVIILLTVVSIILRFVTSFPLRVPVEAIDIFVYFLIASIVFVGSERYLIPMLPVHFFLAARGFAWVEERLGYSSAS